MFLYLRCETVLVIVPKQVENTLVRDGLRIVVQLNCLGVIATVKRQCDDFLDVKAWTCYLHVMVRCTFRCSTAVADTCPQNAIGAAKEWIAAPKAAHTKGGLWTLLHYHSLVSSATLLCMIKTHTHFLKRRIDAVAWLRLLWRDKIWLKSCRHLDEDNSKVLQVMNSSLCDNNEACISLVNSNWHIELRIHHA